MTRLHLPDEPVARKVAWQEAALEEGSVDPVLDGVTGWLWSRWRALAGAGLDQAAFGAVVAGYRRELWLWLAGDRTWSQCCSGLVGRIERRIPG